MSSRKSSRNQPPKMRGPSRPVNPRYVPRAPVKRGPDTFTIGLVGVSSALAVLVVFLLFANRSNNPVPPTQAPLGQQTVINVDPNVGGTATAIAFAASTASLPSITAQEALTLHQTGNAKFVDVRVAPSYATKHIKGAVNVPQADTFNNPKEYPREGNIIVYCQWPNDEESKGVAQALRDNAQYTNVRYLKGGIDAWIAAGGPVEP